jgi:PhzF family phenazine biosynthesis protein
VAELAHVLLALGVERAQELLGERAGEHRDEADAGQQDHDGDDAQASESSTAGAPSWPGKLGVVPLPFRQVDVFTTTPYRGNPVAVVLDGAGLTTEQMQRFAHWTNLSETTFVLPATAPEADYRVRIFTPVEELPFAGHPTLGTCHAWLSAGGSPERAEVVVQECAAGLVPVRRSSDGLAFAAPPLLRSGPVEDSVAERIASVLGVERAAIVDTQWVDNGPGWVAALLGTAEEVLALRPGFVDMDLGVVGPYPEGSPEAFEVRAFFPKDGSTVEDPVTGSLNASLAEWLLRTGRANPPYVASQGTALGRAGRVHVSSDADGTIWTGGGTVTCVSGEVEL